PDLAPTEFYLYGEVKEALRGCRFTLDMDVRDAGQKWLYKHLRDLRFVSTKMTYESLWHTGSSPLLKMSNTSKNNVLVLHLSSFNKVV
ncbi:hypothetical protein TNCV_4102861, partial [Trichonephila clavipes]